MPILVPSDTQAVFQNNAERFDSRSLLLDRFVYDHPKMDEARRLHFARVCNESFGTISSTRASWQRERDQTRNEQERQKLQEFLDDTVTLARRNIVVGPAEPAQVASCRLAFFGILAQGISLYAQLQSRLMVNMAGGTMENAGICLDRFGLPYIPGSAVKGCARRAALAAVHDWCESGQKPGTIPADTDNAFKAVCESFAAPADMLAAIARVFGWCEQDWSLAKKDGRFISDFAWAGSGEPGGEWTTAAKKLCADFGWRIPEKHTSEPWKRLPHFAGSVCFLPAYPVSLGKTGKVAGLPLDVPEFGKLELDVVTCHHRDYYAEPDPKKKPREWKEWNRKWGTAPDTEEPIPVVFPAVAQGHVFAFALAKLRNCSDDDLKQARAWLASGLQTFGLGAKTNAGYGWFNSSDSVQQIVGSFIKKADEERRVKQAQSEADRKRAETKEAVERAEQERLAKAAPFERFHAEYAKLADEPFANQARKFADMTEDQRHGFILALKDRRDTAKRWARRKPELLKPWQEHAQKLHLPIKVP